MREIRPSGSEGGGAFRSPYPYQSPKYPWGKRRKRFSLPETAVPDPENRKARELEVRS